MKIIGKNKTFTPPSYLYKYFSNVDFALKALRGTLHLDDPQSFNDPFEFAENNTTNKGQPKDADKLKISCFTEVNDSILMWAYYANSHKGICLEYDVEEIRKTTSKILDHRHHERDLIYGIHPMHYTPKRWKQSDSIFDKVYKKADVWHHELEWRFAALTDQTDIKFEFVSAVYFGVRTDFGQKNVLNIVALCTIRGIPMYKMEMQEDEYKLIATPYSLA